MAPADTTIISVVDFVSKLTYSGLLIIFIMMLLKEKPPFILRRHHEDVIRGLHDQLLQMTQDRDFWRDYSLRQDELVDRHTTLTEKAISTASKALRS